MFNVKCVFDMGFIKSEATSAMTQQLPRHLHKHNDYNEDDV